MKKETTHYGLTREEFASKAGKHPSCFDDRLRPVCGNGSFHAKLTRNKDEVTCAACKAKMNIETSQELRRRLAGVGVTMLARLNDGADKATATLELLPDYRDRIEFFFMLDNLHPDRMSALRMVVDAYQNKTPLPKIGGVTLF